MNKFELSVRTTLLLAGLGAIFLGVGWLLGGSSGMFMALILSLVMNVGAYWFSDKMVLAIHGAKELTADHSVSQIVRELCERSRTPMPKVYWVQDKAPNAFATGRDPSHAAVAVTEGLLRVLEPHEVRAVLAHELGHVRNRDVLLPRSCIWLTWLNGQVCLVAGRMARDRSIRSL
jgi:heat shock protein HtpX